MGCGRVGATVAGRLRDEGHEVTVLDLDRQAFRRLPDGFDGQRVIGSGTDERVLRRAGIERADAFFAVTQGDNRNLFAAQMAKHMFGVRDVVVRVYDPLRCELFRELGLNTFSPTDISADIAYRAIIDGRDAPAAAGSE